MGYEFKASSQGPIRIFTTRSGRKVELVAVMPECRGVDASQERIIGVCPPRPGEPNRRALRTWKIDGRFLTSGQHDLDIVDIPPEGLAPTVPPTCLPAPAGLPRIQRNCEEIIRQAQDVIARTRLLMLRQANGTEEPERHHGHDLEGAQHQPSQRSAVTGGSGGSLGTAGAGGGGPGYVVATQHGVGGSGAWKPAGDHTDWRKEPLLTEEVGRVLDGMDARHQLLDELITPLMANLRLSSSGQCISASAKRIILTALHEAGFGKPKEATAAGPPAK